MIDLTFLRRTNFEPLEAFFLVLGVSDPLPLTLTNLLLILFNLLIIVLLYSSEIPPGFGSANWEGSSCRIIDPFLESVASAGTVLGTFSVSGLPSSLLGFVLDAET